VTRSKTARTRVVIATAAVLMGAGLATGAAPADALASGHQPTRQVAEAGTPRQEAVARSGWEALWHPEFAKHTPTHYWATKDFIPNTRKLGVSFGCYGHDGAEIRADVVDTSTKKVVGRGSYDYCNNGQKHSLYVGVRTGRAYYMRIYEIGPKHSLWAAAYDWN
jgi:hypothetical protein